MLNREIRFEEISHAEARAQMIEQGYGDAADWLLDGDAQMVGHPQPALGTVPELLGRPSHTFKDWVQANIVAFRSSSVRRSVMGMVDIRLTCEAPPHTSPRIAPAASPCLSLRSVSAWTGSFHKRQVATPSASRTSATEKPESASSRRNDTASGSRGNLRRLPVRTHARVLGLAYNGPAVGQVLDGQLAILVEPTLSEPVQRLT